MKRRTLWQRIIIYGAALLLAVFWFGPFVLVGLGSVIPEANLFSFPPNWFADPPFLGNYKYIFTGEIPQTYLQTGTTRSMVSEEIRWIPYSVFNSFIVALAVMFIVLVLGSLASYAYARLRFPGRKGTFLFVLLSRLIPTVALAVPYYTIVQSLGLLNTRWALIGIYTVLTLPFAVLVLTLYFKSIPKEIDDAARVEGATPLQNLLVYNASPRPAQPGRRRIVHVHAGLQRVSVALLITSSEAGTYPPGYRRGRLDKPGRVLGVAHGGHHDRQHPDDAARLPRMAVHGTRLDGRGGALVGASEYANDADRRSRGWLHGQIARALAGRTPQRGGGRGNGRSTRSSGAGRRGDGHTGLSERRVLA